MRGRQAGWKAALALGLAVSVATVADATTLRRMGLEELARTNEAVVMGRVVDVESRWNQDGSFILTDVTFAPDAVLKGSLGSAKDEIVLTQMGGTIGETTVMILAGAELVPGNEYVLFLSPSELPGEIAELSVRDHCQGSFDVVRDPDGTRVVSQARTHPLLSDDRGVSEPPGGQDGLPIDFMQEELRRFSAAGRK